MAVLKQISLFIDDRFMVLKKKITYFEVHLFKGFQDVYYFSTMYFLVKNLLNCRLNTNLLIVALS